MELRRFKQAGAIFTEDLSNLSYVRKKYTVNGNPTIVDSARGKAIKFNSATGKINTERDFIGTTPLTISGWIKADSAGGGNFGNIIGNGKTIVRVTATGRFQISRDGSTFVGTGTEAFVTGEWIHFVVVANDADPSRGGFYINGEVDGFGIVQNMGTVAAGTTNVIIGNNDGHTRNFDGAIKDVLIFDRILTATEIDNIYKSKTFDYSRIIWNDYNIDGTTLTYSPLNSTQKTNIKNNLKSDGSTSLGLTQLQLDDFGEGNKW